MVSRISFNEENDNQSVLFSVDRYINSAEYKVLQDVADTEGTRSMVTMSFSGAGAKQLPAPSQEAEPVKRPSKRAEVEPTGKQSLADVVSAWGNKE